MHAEVAIVVRGNMWGDTRTQYAASVNTWARRAYTTSSGDCYVPLTYSRPGPSRGMASFPPLKTRVDPVTGNPEQLRNCRRDGPVVMVSVALVSTNQGNVVLSPSCDEL